MSDNGSGKNWYFQGDGPGNTGSATRAGQDVNPTSVPHHTHNGLDSPVVSVNNVGGAVSLSGAQTLSNKTLISPLINEITTSGVAMDIDAGFYGPLTNDTDGATITFNLGTSNIHTVTLGGNRTLAVSFANVGQAFTIILVQDGVGSRTVTWFSTIKWPARITPTLTTTPSKADVFTFICYGSGTYYGFTAGQSL